MDDQIDTERIELVRIDDRSTLQRYLKYVDEEIPDVEEKGPLSSYKSEKIADSPSKADPGKLAAVSFLFGAAKKLNATETPNTTQIPNSIKGTDSVKTEDQKTFLVDTTKPGVYILRLEPRVKPLDIAISPRRTENASLLAISRLAEMYLTESSKATPDIRARLLEQKAWMNQQEALYSDQVEIEICPVCQDNFNKIDLKGIANCEGHLYCQGCIRDYTKTMIDSNRVMDIPCPDSECVNIAVPDLICAALHSFGDYELETRYKRIRNSALALKWGKKICPNEDCYSILETINNGEYATCNMCKINVCLACNNLLHPGQPCARADDASLKRYVDTHNVIKCPYCSVKIIRDRGCNHMTCSVCKHQFCWLCRKAYAPGHYNKFNPFGCPGLQFGQVTKCGVMCQKTKAFLFWFFLILFFPIVYCLFLLSAPCYFYLKRLRNKESQQLKQGKTFTGPGCLKKTFMLLMLALLGIPFLVIGLAVTVIALPLIPIVALCKYCERKCSKTRNGRRRRV